MDAQMLAGLFRRTAMTLGVAAAALAWPGEARAHCDTMDGPVVTAARTALESGQVSGVLIWVRATDEIEVRRAFTRARAVRKLGTEARELADLHFFETVVRLHRQGEGEPYTGLKPAGTDHGVAIPAADQALASGSVAALESLLVSGVREGLHERFTKAVAARKSAPRDVEAGREYAAAYVALLHYVEQVHELGAAHHEEPHAAHP